MGNQSKVVISILLAFFGTLFILCGVVGVYWAVHWDPSWSLLSVIASVVCMLVFGSIFAWILTSLLLDHRNNNAPQWQTMIEALQMSENAKLVLFRDRELELFRTTLQEDISNGDYHSALVLCDRMATVFGAVEEAEQLRTKVQQIIHEQHEARIREELNALQKLLDARQWVEAYQDAARLRRLFPDSPMLHSIEQHIADVRSKYRHGLEERFLIAAKREDVEKAMPLLRELDGYLTPDETRRFRDAATSVITLYRDTLGGRFKLAVNEHRWQEVVEFGEEIIRQFPNAKMAEEVQTILETIRVQSEEDKASS